MSKVYIVSKLNQEYNDEIYSTSDGGTPRNALSSKENAIRECEKLNINEFRGIILNEYCYSLSEIINTRKFEKEEFTLEFNKIFGTTFNEDSNYFEIPNEATDD